MPLFFAPRSYPLGMMRVMVRATPPAGYTARWYELLAGGADVSALSDRYRLAPKP